MNVKKADFRRVGKVKNEKESAVHCRKKGVNFPKV
jgi:hypothetical protein